jgi:hypothetical protein
MASPAPLNTQTIQDAVHIAYTQATDTPLITDDDGILRLNLINKGIDHWQFFNQVRWRELYVYNATGPTIVANTIKYAIAQSDFRELSSRLRILRSDGSYEYVEIYSPEKYARYMDSLGTVANPDGNRVACITGNPANGYQLNLGWIPSNTDPSTGGVIYFDYYKYANKMATMADIPEMLNPQFLVAFATGELFVDDDVNLYTKYSSDADDLLDDMAAENDLLPDYESNAVEDQGEWAGATTGGGGFAMGV